MGSKYKPSWNIANRASPDNWPDQRANWNQLSTSQKAYTIKQYNVFRKNNNLPTIRNPYRKGVTGPDSKRYTIPKGSALAKQYPNYEGVETITPATTNIQLQPDMSVGQWVAKQQQFEIQQLQELFKDPNFVNALFDTSSSSSLSVGNNPGTSGVSSTKRPGDSNVTSAPKKVSSTTTTTSAATPSPISSTSGPSSTSSSSMARAPGTGNDTDMDVAMAEGEGAGRQYSGGFATGIAESNPYVDQPLTVNAGVTIKFQKVHRMLSYGLANELLGLTPAVAGVEVMTSSLAGIPWDVPFFYMNPGEQASLEPGARAISAHIKIVQRNPRVAFETNATTGDLATLNQNKFGLKAIGLNKVQDIRMADVVVTGVATAPANMVPNGIALETVASRNLLDLAMYGVSQANASFDLTIPAQPFMIPLHYNKYAGFFNTIDGVTNATPVGWYDISKHVIQYDMGTMVGQDIVNMSYKFKDAPLRPQLPFIEYLSQTIGGVNYANMVFNDHDTNKEFNLSNITSANNLTTSNPSETQAAKTTTRNNYDALVGATGFRTLVPLEKVQFCRNIDSDRHTSEYVQPSIHIGISPVPRLTPNSTTIGIQPNSWTDVQAYYEITATLEVFIPKEHHCTFANTWHKPLHRVRMADGNMPVGNVPIRFGHYPQTVTAFLQQDNSNKRSKRDVEEMNEFVRKEVEHGHKEIQKNREEIREMYNNDPEFREAIDSSKSLKNIMKRK